MIRRSTLATSLCLCSLMFTAACGDDDAPNANAGARAGAGGGAQGGAGGESGEGGAGSCVARTCEGSGVVCGVLDDGCGHLVTCDTGCADAGGDGGCEPTSCRAEHKNCGRISDGCGAELDCGTCANGDCGSVTPNVCGCPPADSAFDSAPRSAGRATSAGFSGTEQQYLELYDLACETDDDCVTACRERGGSDDMCAASECLDDGGGEHSCLPAPTWSNLQGIQAESDDVSDAAELVVVATRYHDRLLATDLGLEVPASAVVRGITVELKRAGDAAVSDDSVRLLKHGALAGSERASSDPWSEDLEWVTYGGSSDLWGGEWSPEELTADDFGVALAVNYEDSVGNTRAYVDQVRVTVHYSLGCDD